MIATTAHAQDAQPPALLLGAFTDDYGNRYEITPSTFLMLPRMRYSIEGWYGAEQYMIARADSVGGSRTGTYWLRIDWMPLRDMPPYTWAYCFTAYRAPSADSAKRTIPADRTVPRKGCGGYPFSRMQPSGT